MQYKRLPLKDAVFDHDLGILEGYASTFGNVDLGNDIVERGAFSKSLQDISRVKILNGHNADQLPIGKPLQLYEDEKGLYLRVESSGKK